MKTKFLLPVLLSWWCATSLTAQFKNITNHPVSPHERQLLVNPEFRYELKDTPHNTPVNLVYKSVPVPPDPNHLRSGLTAHYTEGIQQPLYISGILHSDFKKRSTPEGAAMDYLSAAGPYLKIKNAEEKFIITSIEKDELQMHHVRMQQVYKGIPVYGAEIVIHGKGQDFDFLNGNYFADFELANTIPALDSISALERTGAELGTLIYTTGTDTEKLLTADPQANLVIFFQDQKPYLAWHVSAYSTLNERWELFVDAVDGKILDKFTSICKLHYREPHATKCTHTGKKAFMPAINGDIDSNESAEEFPLMMDGKATATAQDLFNINRQINTYQVGNLFYLIDAARDIFSNASVMPNDPVGVLWTIDAFNTSPSKNTFRYDHITSTNNTWTSKTSISAHYNSGKAFEYFRNVHNRRSINGNGGNIISLINVADDDGSSMGNAFWNGLAIFYGNGDGAFRELARGLDVAGHEMSHGVIQSTANLEYRNESGALNESFADIFGAMIDRDDWLIGEDVVKTNAFPSGALRSLENPHNGAATNDFNRGWQPKHYNERFTGTADNGGVHINSGIPNHAFFRYASAIGKDKAEKVFYRALTNYLTKSSRFVDCRVAVIKAATDLHGSSSQEVAAARTAFDAVGILGEQQGNYEVDINPNPGQEFVLTVGSNFSGIFVNRPDGTNVGTLTNRGVLSKPSVSDDGTEIVYVGTDNHIYYITINWNTSQVQEQRLSNTPVWRNVVIAKDGSKVAALEKELKKEIVVFNFGTTITSAVFELYNPTFTQDVNTGDVQYADAMEFDLSGEYIMYDANNKLKSNTAGTIEYWDIGFIKVWNNQTKTFSLGVIEKLFPALPSDVSVGNPAFAKNSPYIVAFDYLEGNKFYILGANVERGQVSLLWENNDLGFPNYSSMDNRIVFDNKGNTATNIGVMNLKTNKIEPEAQPVLLLTDRRWASWFSNGSRVLTGLEDIWNKENGKALEIYPNPAGNVIQLRLPDLPTAEYKLVITDMGGMPVRSQIIRIEGNPTDRPMDITDLSAGIYHISLYHPSGKEAALPAKMIKVGK